MAEKYYFGQGRVHIASYGSAKHRWIGDVSALSLAVEVQNIDHFESYSGQKNRARRIAIQTDGSLSLTMHQLDAQNLALALRGSATDIPAISTATATMAIAATPAAGDVYFLPHINITTGTGSTFTIRDAKTVPTTLTLNTHYTLDRTTGLITILALPTGLVYPLTVTYEYGASKQLAMLTTAAPTIALVYAGVNLAENNAPTRVDLYRASLNPLQELQFINNDALGQVALSAALEADSTKPLGGALGQIGRMLELAA